MPIRSAAEMLRLNKTNSLSGIITELNPTLLTGVSTDELIKSESGTRILGYLDRLKSLLLDLNDPGKSIKDCVNNIAVFVAEVTTRIDQIKKEEAVFGLDKNEKIELEIYEKIKKIVEQEGFLGPHNPADVFLSPDVIALSKKPDYANVDTNAEVKRPAGEYVPRNIGERWLLEIVKANPDDIRPPDEADPDYSTKIRERYRRISSYIISFAIAENGSMTVWDEMKIANLDLNTMKYNIGQDTQSISVGALINTFRIGVKPQSIEDAALDEFLGKTFVDNFKRLNVVSTLNERINPPGAKVLMPAELNDVLQQDYSDSFDKEFWKALVEFPPLMIKGPDGVWREDAESLGYKSMKLLKEILKRNRRDLTTNEKLPYAVVMDGVNIPLPDAVFNDPQRKTKPLYHLTGSEQSKAKDKLADGWDPKKTLRVRRIPRKQSPYPIKQEKRGPNLKVREAVYQDMLNNSRGSTPAGDALARYPVVWTLGLADVLGEGPYADCEGGDGTFGKPLGARQWDQIFQAANYALKGFEEGKDTNTLNKALIGAIVSSGISFFDYVGYGGKSLADIIIDCETYDDFRAIQWDRLNDRPTSNWVDAMKWLIAMFTVLKDGYSTTINEYGQYKIETKQIIINQKLDKELSDAINNTLKYVIQGHCAPQAATSDPLPDAENCRFDQLKLLNPTGDFYLYRVVASSAFDRRNTPEVYNDQALSKTLSSRYHMIFQVDPLTLGRWVDVNAGEGKLVNKIVESDPHDNFKKIITIVVDDSKGGRLPSPLDLIERQNVLNMTYVPNARGDSLSKVEINDLMPLGVKLSKSFEEWFQNGGNLGTLSQEQLLIVKAMFPRIQVQSPNLNRQQIMSKELFFEMLIHYGLVEKADEFKAMMGMETKH